MGASSPLKSAFNKLAGVRLKAFLRTFGVIAMILTIFPFIPVDHWTIRIFDFPHLQLTLLTLLALLTYFLRFDIKKLSDYIFVILLTACFLFQGLKIYPYTAFADYEVHNSSSQEGPSLSFYTANVLQKNKSYDKVVRDAKSFDADVLLFTETNEEWRRQLESSLGKDFRSKIEVPMENTYGMLLYSRFELYDENVVFMVEDTIPSIRAKLILPSMDTIQIFAIHPAPPTPQHNPTSKDRDAEMMKIAKDSRDSRLPVVVIGDFNDVAWSETTTLFQNASGLLDLRKGRGLYSTYNAKSWVMRWPLDHVFISPEFRVRDVQRGKKIDSDHFPFYTSLSYEPQIAGEQRLPTPSEEVLNEAFKQIEKEEKEEAN